MSRAWSYHGTLLRWVDGDTARVDLDMGLDHWQRNVTLRIAQIDAREIKTEAGALARVFAEQLVPPGSAIAIKSHSRDKYGRLLASVAFGEPQRDFATAMLEAGHAQVYEPGAR